jgi:Zn-dependent peptidase ImmA (M78 family)
MFRRGFKTWAEEIAARVRRKLRLPEDAALDPMALATLLSVIVLVPDDLSDLPADCRRRLAHDHSENWSAITVANAKQHLIVINSSHTPARRNSNLAHELAHVILGHEPSLMFASPKSGTALRTHNKEQEDEANWLAGCLLLPKSVLFSIRRRRLKDEQACVEYGVSVPMLRFRMNVSGVEIQLRRSKRRRT